MHSRFNRHLLSGSLATGTMRKIDFRNVTAQWEGVLHAPDTSRKLDQVRLEKAELGLGEKWRGCEGANHINNPRRILHFESITLHAINMGLYEPLAILICLCSIELEEASVPSRLSLWTCATSIHQRGKMSARVRRIRNSIARVPQDRGRRRKVYSWG